MWEGDVTVLFLTVCFLQVRVYFDFKIIVHCQGSVLRKRGNVLMNNLRGEIGI